MKTSAYAQVKKTCTTRGSVRKIWITLKEDLKDEYFDEDGNLQFKGEYLEEVTEEANITANTSEETLVQLLQRLLDQKEEKQEEKNAGKLAKEFTIEKFDGKTSNADQWITAFEKECERFKVTTSGKRIEILKSFMDKGALDWYSCTLIRLTIEAAWSDWKENFCTTFASRGWTPIRYAMTYKYQAGSLLEYSIKKEKLLLQIKKTIDDGTLIDLIATSLPNHVADRIDREKLKKVEDLHNEIGKLPHLNKSKPNTKGKIEKIPYKVCSDKGKGTRFHAEADCWFKNQENRGNTSKHVNNLVLEVEQSEIDLKN